jgi:hypothetical protein
MRRIAVFVLTASAVLLAACGVNPDARPRAIPANQVPFDLLATSTTEGTDTTLPIVTVKTTVYMIGPNRLVGVSRSVPIPLTLGSALASVVQGPTSSEESSGLRSAINPTTSVLNAQINGNTALVNLSDSFTDIGLQDQIYALAQLVYTATELPNVMNVQISLNGRPEEVPRGDGSTTSGLLTRADYAAVGPAPS